MLHIAAEGVLARAAAVPGDARRHRPQLPRGHRVPRRSRSSGSTCNLVVASVQESIDAGRVVEDTGPRASRNRLQTTTLLDAIEEHGFDAVMGGARPRRGEGPRQGALLLVPRRVRPVGPEEPAPRDLDRSTTAGTARVSTSACSRCRTGPSSTSGSTSPTRTSSCPSIYFAHRRAGVPPRRHADGGHRVPRSPATAKRCSRRRCATARSATRRAPPRSSRCAASIDDVIAEVAASRDHRAGRDPRRRQVLRSGHGRPQAGGLLLDGAAAVRHRGLGRRRQVDADRAPALRLEADLRGHARGARALDDAARRGGHEPRAAHRRPAGRARAGHHDRRRVPLLRHAAPQVHHRRHARATCSTRATWSPARRPPTSR